MQYSRNIFSRRIQNGVVRATFPLTGFLTILCALCLAFGTQAQSTYENYTFVTVVGPGDAGPGFVDGIRTSARFGNPVGIARDGAGNLYVADSFQNTIRKIAPNGLVTTLAGLAGFAGTNDGIGAAARFNTPYGIAVGNDGTVYVADSNNHTIRKILPSGVVTTLAGSAGNPGTANGTGTAAKFNLPRGLVVDANNNLFVADTSNNAIRKITPAGVVTTFAGTIGFSGSANKTGTSASFNLPVGITMDAQSNLYVADWQNSLVRKITPAAAVSTVAGDLNDATEADGTNSTAHFHGPFGITVNGTDGLYVVDSVGETIRKVTFDGVVTTIAGSANQSGAVDAVGTAARFRSPSGIVSDGQTNFYVCDFGNNAIRQIVPDFTVTVFAGAFGGSGSVDATGNAARFKFPADIAFDNNGNGYISDLGNNTIRKMAPDGTVTTLAGVAGASGTNDGTGAAARFFNPIGLALDQNGNIFVADSANNTVREVTPLGTVSTVAGLGGSANTGTNNGTGSDARFNDPFGIALDTNGNIFVADTHNHEIREITPGGVVTTFAGSPVGIFGTNDGVGTSAQFDFPEGIALDGNGNFYVADDGSSAIRKIAPDTSVSTFAGIPGTTGSADGAGSASTFNFPFGMAVDSAGNVYVGDTANNVIRKITPAGVVTTIGGLAGQPGSADGTGSDARFDAPEGVSVDSQGNVYVADSSNHSIRKGNPALPDMPVIDFTNADTGVTCHFSISNKTTTSWSWSFIRQPAASTNQIIGANTDTPTFTPDVEDIYIVQFQGWDNSGRTVIHRITIQAHNGNRLTVLTKGGGTVKPNLNGSHLQIGNVYSMTAKAVPGSTFSNWTAIIGTNGPFVFTNSPAISFPMSNDLTLTANFIDHQNPTLLITSPKSAQFASNAQFTATGTAKDNDRVAAVYYQLNGGVWTNATGTNNWSANLVLNPGTNAVLAYAQDPSGRVSTTNRATLNYVPSVRLNITGTGSGTLVPAYNGALLAVGTNYTITIKPSAGFIFSNWLDHAGNLLSTNPTLTFTMQSNTAFFVNLNSNHFYWARGNYAGLFFDTNNLTATNAGFFSAAVTPTASFTAKILVGGSTVSFSGQFSSNGVFSSTFVSKGFNTPFTVQLQLDLSGAGTITGTIANSGWSVPLLANQDIYSTANPPSQQFQRFALVIPGDDEDSSNQPGGNSFGTVILDGVGGVSIIGSLADGSPVAQQTFISKDGSWPFYISSAGGQGVTLGWLTFSPGQRGTLSGQVYWERLPQANASLYPAGFNFTNGITVAGSFFDYFFNVPTLIVPNGGQLVLQQAAISPALTNYFTLTVQGAKDIVTSTNQMKLNITFLTGAFKGTVVNPANNLSIPISGVILTNQNAGFGYFINSNQSGSVFFSTNAP